MKIDRHSRVCCRSSVKLPRRRPLARPLSWLGAASVVLWGLLLGLIPDGELVLAQDEQGPAAFERHHTPDLEAERVVASGSGDPANGDSQASSGSPSTSQPRAVTLLRHTIARLAHGAAFSAKVRQRVWTLGREAAGFGTYEQAGNRSGRFNLQLTMHEGSGKHTLQQISDGRLAWTRTMVAEQVSLRRVDVGRLDEWIPAAGLVNSSARHAELVANPQGKLDSMDDQRVAPRLKVGAWTELLDTIERDHILRLGSSTIQDQRVLVLVGEIRPERRRQIIAEANGTWPDMYPALVKVAIAIEPDPQTGFGEGLPIRFEFWSDPIELSGPQGANAPTQSRLITLIEMYSLRPMTAPPIQRFRFENQDSEVNFVNETDRYLDRYGVRITDNQRRMLLR